MKTIGARLTRLPDVRTSKHAGHALHPATQNRIGEQAELDSGSTEACDPGENLFCKVLMRPAHEGIVQVQYYAFDATRAQLCGEHLQDGVCISMRAAYHQSAPRRTIVRHRFAVRVTRGQWIFRD